VKFGRKPHTKPATIFEVSDSWRDFEQNALALFGLKTPNFRKSRKTESSKLRNSAEVAENLSAYSGLLLRIAIECP
jgi:hypothetical protein